MLRLKKQKVAITYPRNDLLNFDIAMDDEDTIHFFEEKFPELIAYLKEISEADEYASESEEDGHDIDGDPIMHSLSWVLLGKDKRSLQVVGFMPNGETISVICGRPHTAGHTLYIGESVCIYLSIFY